ncbi:MAG TPA: dihydroxy-acid dehydratase, partial [Lentisphaeria bacterium]|nr:dihydroxy-acid dehydratase [Lentisphaeria bacterium]
LKDGDIIDIDINNYALNADLSDGEWEKRRLSMKLRVQEGLSGYLKRYARNVLSADQGAAFKD